MAEGSDASLYLSEDTKGVIYRITHTGSEQAGSGALEPANAEGAQIGMAGAGSPSAKRASPPAGSPDRLATDIVEPKGGPIDVLSSAFGDGQPIPATYAAEQGDVSPPLDWAEGPEGTRSCVVMVEDPDVSKDRPFAHWLAYNIPAEVTDLREGVPHAPQLPLPERAKQGANDHGSTGWFGMRPPIGGPAHHYHFQVFALDTKLDLAHGASRAQLLDGMRGDVPRRGRGGRHLRALTAAAPRIRRPAPRPASSAARRPGGSPPRLPGAPTRWLWPVAVAVASPR